MSEPTPLVDAIRSAYWTDPWGDKFPALAFAPCDFTAPNGLPCTSNKVDHPAMHYTSDAHCWAREPQSPIHPD